MQYYCSFKSQPMRISLVISQARVMATVLLVVSSLSFLPSCGKKVTNQNKRKFKAWGMIDQHKETAMNPTVARVG